MASGFRSPLFILGLANGSGSSSGVRSMLAPWIGGASSPAGATTSGFRGMLAFWAGGAANAGAESEQIPLGQGNWYKRGKDWADVQARFRWAEGYRKRKAELLGIIPEDDAQEVAELLGQRESAAEEASLALDQRQDIFLRDALEVLRRTEARLASMGIQAPAFESQEIDMAYVIFMVAALDE